MSTKNEIQTLLGEEYKKRPLTFAEIKEIIRNSIKKVK